jgi:hypothetical protein
MKGNRLYVHIMIADELRVKPASNWYNNKHFPGLKWLHIQADTACCSPAHPLSNSSLGHPHKSPETDEFTLDAAAVVAEEAVERKEARRVKPWLRGAGGGPAGVILRRW